MNNSISTFLIALLLLLSANSIGQNLTLEKIMQDPKWMGNPPSQPEWQYEGKFLIYKWKSPLDTIQQTYTLTLNQGAKPEKNLDPDTLIKATQVVYSYDRKTMVISSNGDLIFQRAGQKAIPITVTQQREFSPVISPDGNKVYYQSGNQLFSWKSNTGTTRQITHFTFEKESSKKELSESDKWLEQQQLNLFDYLKNKPIDPKPKSKNKPIYLGKGRLNYLNISPNSWLIVASTVVEENSKSTEVPYWITSDGQISNAKTRAKVGTENAKYQHFVFINGTDSVRKIDFSFLPGILKIGKFNLDYGRPDSVKSPKEVYMCPPIWNSIGTNALVVIRSLDNKDRWITNMDTLGKFNLIEHQHNEAWIGGPGIGSFYMVTGNAGWINPENCWFQSEKTGFSHVYTYNLTNNKVSEFTSGNWEVSECWLSNDKKTFYLTGNNEHPGEQHLYRKDFTWGRLVKISGREGAWFPTISPYELFIAYRYSNATTPWEIYLAPNKTGVKAAQITQTASPDFLSKKWISPQIVKITARDTATIYGRLYQSNVGSKQPAVIFVHGAGYLQNAHKWWSQYFREYMFHNFLVQQGYTVLDIDYRGSAGYGAEWRTGIYRHMGGKDLSDHVDAAKWLVETKNVDASKIGIYGGSYGGFITLMAMFNESRTFKTGAALRSVTDWAHYNHGYTSNILNEPTTDSLAYIKSSPIYFAEGLKGSLLMCHGMVDENVHFQDVVRLSQRLIELKKDNWELAVYPVEDHGFKEPSSWLDEYKRIFKLFEKELK